MIITQTQIERDFTSYDGKIIEVYHQPILDMDRSKFDPIQIRYYKRDYKRNTSRRVETKRE